MFVSNFHIKAFVLKNIDEINTFTFTLHLQSLSKFVISEIRKGDMRARVCSLKI